MKKNLVGILLLVAIIIASVGCSNSNDNGAESVLGNVEATSTNPQDNEEDEYTIAVLAWSMAEEFGVDIVEGAKEKATEIGGINVIYPDPAGDMQKEIAIFEDLIQQKVDAICVAPVDADAIVPYIDKARDAGIVIVDYDIETEAEVDAKVLSDNREGGAIAAEYLVNEMGTEGTVLVLTEIPGVTTAEERIAGFEDKIAEMAPNIKLIEQLSNGTRDTHRATTENMLQAYPEITGIFAFMGDNTLGAYTACKSNNRTDVLIAGYDASPEQVEILKKDGPDSNLICSVALYPRKIGALSLETAYNILEGEEVDDVIWTEIGLLEAKKVDEF